MYCLRGKESAKTEFSLKRIDQKCSVKDHFVRTSTSFYYINNNKSPLESEYTFPKSAPISNVLVRITNTETNETKTLVAKIELKEKSQEKYDDAIASGNSAMLMKQKKSLKKPVVVLSLGNIQPKHEVCVVLERTEQLIVKISEEEEGIVKMRHIIESMLLDDQNYIKEEKIVKLMKVEYEIDLKLGILLKIDSPSHKNDLKIEKQNDGTHTIRTINAISNDRSLILDITVKDLPIASWLVDKRGSAYSHQISIIPNIKKSEIKQKFREIIIVVDRSGSMSGQRMEYAKRAVKLMLYSLDEAEKTRFNIVSFGSAFSSLFPESRLFCEETFNQAKILVDSMKADFGGTNMFSPLKSILSEPAKTGYQKMVYLITDGEDECPVKTSDLVFDECSDVKIYSLGVGQGINPKFLLKLSKYSNGKASFIENNSEIEEIVMEQLDVSFQVEITDLEVKFPNGMKSIRVDPPNEFNSAIVNNRLYRFHYFSKNYVEANNVEISYKYEGKSFSHTVPPVFSKMVGIVAADKRVKYLEKNKIGKKEIANLGILYSILTSQTSFVLVSENEKKIDEEMVFEKIPSVLFAEYEIQDNIRLENLRKIKIEMEQDENERKRRKQKKEEDEKKKAAQVKIIPKIQKVQPKIIPKKVPSPKPVVPPQPPKPIVPRVYSARENEIFMAKVAEQAERYDECFEYIKRVADTSVEMTVEERNLLSVAMKNIVGQLRSSWRVASAIIQQQSSVSSSKFLPYVVQYKKDIVQKLLSECDKAIQISQKMNNVSTSDEGKCFFLKLVGDYNRYRCEVFDIDVCSDPEKEKDKYAKLALKAYKQASIAADKLSTTHPVKLGLGLNLSVFYYEIMNDPETACKIAKDGFENSIEELDTLTEEEYKDSTLIMQLYKDNLTLWANESGVSKDDDDEDLDDSKICPQEPDEEPTDDSKEKINGENDKLINDIVPGYDDEKKSKGDVVGKISLNNLIFLVDHRGIWKFGKNVADALVVQMEEIQKNAPNKLDESSIDLWMTAIVVVVLELLFGHLKIKWQMIVRKSKKRIPLEMLQKAKMFVKDLKL